MKIKSKIISALILLLGVNNIPTKALSRYEPLSSAKAVNSDKKDDSHVEDSLFWLLNSMANGLQTAWTYGGKGCNAVYLGLKKAEHGARDVVTSLASEERTQDLIKLKNGIKNIRKNCGIAKDVASEGTGMIVDVVRGVIDVGGKVFPLFQEDTKAINENAPKDQSKIEEGDADNDDDKKEDLQPHFLVHAFQVLMECKNNPKIRPFIDRIIGSGAKVQNQIAPDKEEAKDSNKESNPLLTVFNSVRKLLTLDELNSEDFENEKKELKGKIDKWFHNVTVVKKVEGAAQDVRDSKKPLHEALHAVRDGIKNIDDKVGAFVDKTTEDFSRGIDNLEKTGNNISKNAAVITQNTNRIANEFEDLSKNTDKNLEKMEKNFEKATNSFIHATNIIIFVSIATMLGALAKGAVSQSNGSTTPTGTCGSYTKKFYQTTGVGQTHNVPIYAGL